MFNFLKETLSNIYNQFTNKIRQLFKVNQIDQGSLDELEKILITADTGVTTTNYILNNIKEDFKNNKIKTGQDLKVNLYDQLLNLLDKNEYNFKADVYLLVGINGSGKTTFAGKLGNLLKSRDKKTLLVAADTFRAAAKDQLNDIAKKLDIDIVCGKENQDPASVIYLGCQEYIKNNYDNLIIDTAGRLQTKINLMRELQKIKQIINKLLPNKKLSVLLTIDSMLGQNSLDQARVFNECTDIDGIVLTKMDGTGKGGIVFSISKNLNIPIAFISYGEKFSDLKLFNPEEYVNQLINS